MSFFWHWSGLFLLDLGSLVASLEAIEQNLKKKQCWLDRRTHRQLRDAAGALAMACKTVEGPVFWGAMSERHLEKRFGRLRSMFPTSKMSCADFWRSSAITMRKELSKWDHSKEPICEDSGPVSDATFEATVARAFRAALRLMTLCSGRLEEDLRSSYAMAHSCPTLRSKVMNDDCEDAGEQHPEEPPEASAEEVVRHVRESQAFATAMSKDVDKLFGHECDESRASLLHERSAGSRGDVKIAAATDHICNLPDEKPKSDSDTAVHPQDQIFAAGFQCWVD